jgi:hypothetical protein
MPLYTFLHNSIVRVIYHRHTLKYSIKLAQNSSTGGGRSVGVVRSRTKATEFFLRKPVRLVAETKMFLVRSGQTYRVELSFK